MALDKAEFDDLVKALRSGGYTIPNSVSTVRDLTIAVESQPSPRRKARRPAFDLDDDLDLNQMTLSRGLPN